MLTPTLEAEKKLKSLHDGCMEQRLGERFPAEPLTVDADDFDHGDGEEGQGCHVHLDQHGGDQEHYQDHKEAAGDPPLLRNPGEEDERERERKEGQGSAFLIRS